MAEKFEIIIDADSSKLISELENATKYLKNFQNIISDTKGTKIFDDIIVKVTQLQKVLSALKTSVPTIDINANTSEFISQINNAETILNEIKSIDINISADSSQVISETTKVENELLNIKPVDITITADTSQVTTEVNKAENQLQNLKPVEIPVTADATPIIDEVNKAENKLENIKPVEVPITVNSSNLVSELQKAQNNLRKFEAALKKSTNIGEIEYLSRNIGLLKSKIDTLNVAQGKLTSGSNKAAFALNDLSRIAQDAPYGFIGISNNINPLLESFQRLQKEAKDTGVSVGSLLSKALSGPAGLGLAVGIAGAAITFMETGLSRWIRTSKDAASATNDFGINLNDFNRKLKDSKNELDSFLNNLDKFQKLQDLEIRLKITGADSISEYKRSLEELNVSQQINLQKQQRVGDEYYNSKELLDQYTNSLNTFIGKQGDNINLWNEATNKSKNFIDGIGGIENAYKLTEEEIKSFDESGQDLLRRLIEQQKQTQSLGKNLSDLQFDYKTLGLQIQVTNQIEKDRLSQLKKDTDSIDSILAKFQAKLIAINKTGLALKTPDFKISTEQIKAYESVIEELITKFPKSKALPPAILKLQLDLEGLKSKYINQKLQDTIKEVQKQSKLAIFFDKSTIDEQISIIKSAYSNISEITKNPFLIIFKLWIQSKEAEKRLEEFRKNQQKIADDAKLQTKLDVLLNTPKLEAIKGQISKKLADITDLIKNWNDKSSPQLEIRLKTDLKQLRIEEAKAKIADLKDKAKDLQKLSIYFDESTVEEQISNIKGLIRSLQEDPNLPFMMKTAWILRLVVDLKALKLDSWKDKVNKQFTDTFESIAENTAISFGQLLGDRLTGKVNVDDWFKGVFNSLGANIEELGKFLVKSAIEIELIKKTLFSNPITAVIGGIALIAIGRAIANATKKNAFATGTRYAPGGMALVGERGPEMINLPRGSQVVPAAQTAHMMGGIGGQVEVFGVLRGQDIYFSNKKYSQTYNRTT